MVARLSARRSVSFVPAVENALVLVHVLAACLSLSPCAPDAPADRTRVLVEALRDADEDVRGLAAQLLGEVAEPRPDVTEALGARLLDEEEAWRVRAAAARALGLLAGRDRDGRVLASAALLASTASTDLDCRVRGEAARALARAQPEDPAAAAALRLVGAEPCPRLQRSARAARAAPRAVGTSEKAAAGAGAARAETAARPATLKRGTCCVRAAFLR